MELGPITSQPVWKVCQQLFQSTLLLCGYRLRLKKIQKTLNHRNDSGQDHHFRGSETEQYFILSQPLERLSLQDSVVGTASLPTLPGFPIAAASSAGYSQPRKDRALAPSFRGTYLPSVLSRHSGSQEEILVTPRDAGLFFTALHRKI